jgi:selenide,water dikinase
MPAAPEPPGGTASPPAPASASGSSHSLVLLGGGHAQLSVLADLAARPLPGWNVTLISPYRRQIYSGMLPGWIAGHYPIEACAIALDRLADAAGVTLHTTRGQAVDPSAGWVTCADGNRLRFDRLSIDTGPEPALHDLPGSAEFALPLRPIEAFIAAWPALARRIAATRGRFELVLLGAGAAGLELAFAIRHRAQRDGWHGLRISLVGAEPLPLPGAPWAARRQAAALLAQRGIAWWGERRATRLTAGTLHTEPAAPRAFDACLLCTGTVAPAWPAASGLAVDAQGFVRVGPTLQSLSHPQVMAAGDVAAYATPRPKSGVYAVRAGPQLAHNLRAACEGRPLRPWTPQARALYLISTGDRHALATWGRWSWHGDWVWRWKDHIDRRFMRRFGTAV